MNQKKGVYLSNATRKNEYEYGYFNSIIAPVGSGKNYYSSSSLLSELNNSYGLGEKYTVILAPYLALKSQIESGGVYKTFTQIHEDSMDAFSLFDTTESQDKPIGNEKLVMTPHRFLKLLLEEEKTFSNSHELRDFSHIINSIDTIIIDESDHVFTKLPLWESADSKGNRNIFKEAVRLIIKHLDDVMVIGITATGEDKLKKAFGEYYNPITFNEELKKQEFSSVEGYSEMKLIFNRAVEECNIKFDNENRLAVYTERIDYMLKQREYFERLGYNVSMVVSDSASKYTMTPREKAIKEELITTGKSDLVGDVLLYNAAMERGLSIIDKRFKGVIIHSSEEDVQIQAAGRFRFDNLKLYLLNTKYNRTRPDLMDLMVDKETGAVTNVITIPEEYLNKPLTKNMKDELIDDIQFSRKWTSLKRVIIKNGYNVKEHTMNINKKRTRVSTITQSGKD